MRSHPGLVRLVLRAAWMLSIVLGILASAPPVGRVVLVEDVATESRFASSAEAISRAVRAAVAAQPGVGVVQAEVEARRADRLLTGRLGALGDELVLTLRLADVDGRSFSGDASCAAPDLDGIIRCAGEAVEALFGRSKARASLLRAESRIAVLGLEAIGVGAPLAATLTEVLLVELKSDPSLFVISRAEVEQMLSYEAQRQMLTCENDEACLAAIAGALGVQFLVGGTIGRLDDTFVVSLKLMDLERAEVLHRVTESFAGEEESLVLVLRHVARAVLGRTRSGRGELRFVLDPPDAEVVLDGTRTVARARTTTVSAGKHALSIHADGFQPLHRDLFIGPGQTIVVQEQLSSAEPEWYASGWLWGSVGAVAVAATVIAVAVAARPDAPAGSLAGTVPWPH